ncbi:MAG: adenylate/guanylate cyclase domain-containing protein [Nocardioides sp.]|uniref:adenylate/guanylate cyclase domain-containing protein n=1 Tax=Nocardioides sp. TaxID=35761 RepID=UPI0039E5A70B
MSDTAGTGQGAEGDRVGSDPLTSAEVADEVGLSLANARRLWRALGFPEVGDEERFFDAEDVHALTVLQEITASGLVDFDLAVNLTRGMGQAMARLSDYEVSALLHHIETLGGGGADGPRDTRQLLRAAVEIIDEFSDSFEELMRYSWRRHMRAALARAEASFAGTDEVGTVQLTVGFADIVSFTALSNTLTEEKIGDLVELFESRCADVVAVQRGRVIKSLGDSVLFVNDDAVRAYDTAEGIINVVGRDPRMPDVRVGLASGSIVTRLGDVFGPPVNMAARLTAVARRNRIIIDEATASALPDDEFETRRMAARPVRGFGIVEPVAVRRS